MPADATTDHANADDDDVLTPSTPRERHPFSRRTFMRTGAIGAVAAGMISAIPGLSGLLGGASAAAPELSGVASEAETAAPGMSGPIIAHVTDAATGDLNLYFGEREVAWRDPVLVQHLLRAAR